MLRLLSYDVQTLVPAPPTLACRMRSCRQQQPWGDRCLRCSTILPPAWLTAQLSSCAPLLSVVRPLLRPCVMQH